MKLLIKILAPFFLLIIWTNNAKCQNSSKIIRVNFQEMTLVLYDASNQLIKKFLIALPRKTPPLPIKGWIKSIELNANWYPTQKTRDWYLEKNGIELPEIIPAGDPLNAIGAGKINIVFEENQEINPLIKIHGTNDPKSIGTRITRGCIRLKDEDFLELVKLIGKEKVLIIFE